MLGQNVNVKTNVNASDGAYIALIILMFCGAVLALFLCDAQKIVRADGTKVILRKNPSWKSEFVGLWETLRFEPFVLLLFPMFWVSNWFYTYQGNSVNGGHFDTRTKALNDFMYWFAQILAATCIGPILDLKYFRRTVRARGAFAILVILTLAIYGGGYAFQKGYTRQTPEKANDWTSPGYVGPMFLYFFYGFFDACWQGTVYWYAPSYATVFDEYTNANSVCPTHRFMGALSNSGRNSANYVGFYKGIQSAGAAVMWAWDSTSPPYMTEFASNWGLLLGALLCAAPVVFLKIKDSVPVEVDLQGTNETIEDVLPVAHQDDKQATV